MKQTRQRKKGKLYNRKAMALLFIGFLMLFCLVNVLVRDKEFSEKENPHAGAEAKTILVRNREREIYEAI